MKALIDKLICKLFGHKYLLIEKYTREIRRVGCSRCGTTWAMDDVTKTLLPWDDEFGKIASYMRSLAE